MSINQLNGTGTLPLLSTTTSTVQKTSVPNTDNAPSPASPARSKVGNKPESEEQIKQAVQKIQGAVDNLAHNLRFSIDEDTGKTIIKVMDVHTEEVIRQIPTEEAVQLARTLDKVQGLLFNDKA
ncbi:flagellar protein FlaG protein [Nitrosomonas sp. Is79A3]|uniref:flagellar protein FlaG n=1 Tax=Nitrosomonas sp. (strain Is79A3) TaxID=261292 RepID=UPI000215D395